MSEKKSRFSKFGEAYYKVLALLVVPMLCSFLLGDYFGEEMRKQSRCLFVVLVMGSYWCFEVAPVAVVALMPMILFPIFEIATSEQVARQYLPDTSFLFIGGLMVATAIEKSELHNRIALYVLSVVGSQPSHIMAGFMSVTGVLSMFISNTATAALMVPITQSVTNELVDSHRRAEMIALSTAAVLQGRRRSVDLRRLSLPQEHIVTHQRDISLMYSPKELKMAKGLMLSVCFAANIGGSATITGTASNLVLIGQLEKLFPGADTGINFLSWICFSFPMVCICMGAAWFILTMMFLREAPRGTHQVSARLRQQYSELPEINFHQISVSVCFFVLLLLWILRDPQFIAGFGSYFKHGYVTDATSAIFIAILLFVLPKEVPACLKGQDELGNYKARGALLSWDEVQENFPWSVVFLLGGGFAMAHGVKTSQLSATIGDWLTVLESFQPYQTLIICVIVTVFATNICSNTVVASIFLPIVSYMARSFGVNPLYFMLPVCMASSFAFCLPVATPPNAIVHGAGIVTNSDLFKAGALLSVFCVFANVANIVLWGSFILQTDQFPDWAAMPEVNQTLINAVNSTLSA